jgi:hypothetical protein
VGCYGLHRDRQEGLECQNVLQHWCSSVMGSVGVTTLHHLGTGDLELSPPPPAPEVVPSCNALILEKNRIL